MSKPERLHGLGLRTFVLDPPVLCRCGNRATHMLEVHAVDCCTSERPTRASFLCKVCLTENVSRVSDILFGESLRCKTCGLTMMTIADMIVRSCPLEKRTGR